jgi:hypothetical protein
MTAKITVREGGGGKTSIAGVAVGYSDDGVLIVQDVALDRLAQTERRRIAAELRQLADRLDKPVLN